MNAKEPGDQYPDTNNRDIEAKQHQEVRSSEAIRRDDSIDHEAVTVLPGTGGPDDVGDSEVAPEDYDRTGHAGLEDR